MAYGTAPNHLQAAQGNLDEIGERVKKGEEMDDLNQLLFLAGVHALVSIAESLRAMARHRKID